MSSSAKKPSKLKKPKKAKLRKGRAVKSVNTYFVGEERGGEDQGRDVLVAASVEAFESGSIADARANWYFGEWQALADIDLDSLSSHPDIAKFAALKASGHQQLGDVVNAEKYMRLARDLGCDNGLIARLLVAGAHNALGRVAALKKDDARVQKHFEAAVDVGEGTRAANLASHARSVKEMTNLGLLPQAAGFVNRQLANSKSLSDRPTINMAKQSALETQMELINHQLSLAYQKQQGFVRVGGDESQTVKLKDKKDLKRISPSQLGQDIWVLEKLDFKREGYFVEFGATNGVNLSNTFLLESEFGWRGICAEPNPAFFKDLIKKRCCITSNACIAGESGKIVEFVLADEYGGIKDYANSDMHSEKRRAFANMGKVVKLETISLHDFLLENNAPKVIDYMSIDTEGSEWEILQNFPFDEWEIRCMTVEHNYTAQREMIAEKLASVGFTRQEADYDDWYYRSEK